MSAEMTEADFRRDVESVAESFMVSFLARVPLPGVADEWALRVYELSRRAHNAAAIFVGVREEMRGEQDADKEES